MISHLGFPHVYLDPSENGESERFKKIRKVASVATGYSRGSSKLTANMDSVTYPDELYIKLKELKNQVHYLESLQLKPQKAS